MVGLIMAGLYSAGLFFCGTPMSLFIGLLAGLANLVPYLGLVVGFVPAAILTFMQTQDWVLVFGVAGVFVVVQGLEGMIITPRIVGEKIGLHPVAIILAVLLGAEVGSRVLWTGGGYSFGACSGRTQRPFCSWT
jgi:predicted PurR-regulated permease PerM